VFHAPVLRNKQNQSDTQSVPHFSGGICVTLSCCHARLNHVGVTAILRTLNKRTVDDLYDFVACNVRFSSSI
jgi:hypothetical protein